MYLFAGSWVLFLFGIIAIIFSVNGYPILYTVYSALIALLFSMFLVYDTQQVQITGSSKSIDYSLLRAPGNLSQYFSKCELVS